MAVMLKSSAVSAVSKGTKSSFYSGYGGKPNPVFQALEQEVDAFKTFMQKRVGRKSKRPKDEASSLTSDRLFDIWNKYESRLPKMSYQKRLLEMGDFLSSIKEFNLALWQCYGRYLTSFGEVNVEEITSVEQFKQEFFPDGFETEDAGFTFRALMGRSICTYEVVRMNDPKLLNTESVDKCLQLLSFLRLVTQVILPKESLYWLVYNGTIHIYSISRHLMSFGHSAAVLEYLLWVAMCMEASIPLLGVKYVDWRTTLYTAVCQCYYDCKAGQHAEAFARRALSKLNELSQLEYMSNAKQSIEVERTFRLATVKMGIMVFKRTVFETRKRPKGLLRPKTRANLKDALNQPWPRTQSEKLLAEMFEGSSAQILCLLETLTDSNRRTLLSCPPAPDSDVEILDVFAELFMAAQEIISGGGGLTSVGGGALSKKDIDLRSLASLKGVINERPLTEMAAQGDDGVPLSAVIKLVRLAYCYEQWDFFDNMIELVLYATKEVENDKFLRDGKCLEITQAYDRVSPRFKHRRLFIVTDDDDEAEAGTTGPAPSLHAAQSASKSTIVSQPDDLIRLAEVLLSVVTGPFTTDTMDMDMMIDACLLLWNKCKNVFQKFQTGSADNPRYLQKMDNPSKWVYILDIVHQVLGWCGLSAVDPALMAEVVLRLALVFEASATLELSQDRKPKPGAFLLNVPSKSITSSRNVIGLKSPWSGDQGPGVSEDLSNLLGQASYMSWNVSLLTRPTTPVPVDSQEIIKRPIQQQHAAKSDVALSPDLMSSRPESQRTTLMSEGGKESTVGGAHLGSASLALWRRQREQAARDQLIQARDILELGLQNVSYARQVVALTDGKSIADISWVKELNKELFSPVRPAVVEETEGQGEEDGEKEAGKGETEKSDAMAVWNMVRDLHLELIFMYHRICVKLSMLGQDQKKQKQAQDVKMAKRTIGGESSKLPELNVPVLPGLQVKTFQDLLSECNKDHISKSLLHMQKALQLGCHANPTDEQKALLEEAARHLKQAEGEEKYLFIENTVEETADLAGVERTRVPPPPILLSRTDTKMVFRPAAFNPSSGAKVAWYRIFARQATGANVKVRLNDYFLPGTGQPVPSFRCELSVSGLTPRERYMFAVAAFSADGKLIGGMVGDSTKAILASHPMPILMAWSYLSQTAYQVGYLHAVAESSLVLWRHFVAQPPPPEDVVYVTSVERDFKLTLLRLNKMIVGQTSPVLLRMFLASIFAYVDVRVKQGQLFCDRLSDHGPLYPGQVKRLRLCERMLVAMELSGWLNESSLALQAVIQSYGLLAPLIHYKIPVVPVMQVLERCLIVLQEIPPGQRKRRSQTITEGLHHMVACLTYHLAKVLRMWNQKALAGHINEAGRKMLSVDMDKDTEEDAFPGADKATENGSVAAKDGKDKKKGGAGTAATAKGKKVTQVMSKEDIEETRNEELRALEEHILCLSRQAQGEQELIGNEDIGILHAYITYLPSRFAYNQVVKFKRRARYLEFFVQVADKALAEEAADLALDWCLDTSQWLNKRNDGILGISRSSTNIGGGKQRVSASADDKKYAATVVEYSRDKAKTNKSDKTKDSKQAKQQKGPKAKGKGGGGGGGRYRPIGVTPSMTDSQKEAQEELEVKAIAVLDEHFMRLFHAKTKLKRLRRITTDEMPWRAQLNLIHGLCSFEVFLGKLDFTERFYSRGQQYQQWTSFLDPEWFTMETAGTMVVAGTANLSHQQLPSAGEKSHRSQKSQKSRSDISKRSVEPQYCTGIQVAAAIATGRQLTGSFPIPLGDIEIPLKGVGSVVMAAKGKKDQQTKPSVELTPVSSSDATQILDSTFGLLQKALVLAHRGQHWMLLQNVCRAMWNCVATAMLRVQVPDRTGRPLISMATLRSLTWPLMWTAADSLLDMIVQLQQQQLKLQQKKKKKMESVSETVKSAFGTIDDEIGGATLKFESPLDDITTVDLRLLRRVVLRSLELLHYANKWERLVDIAYRFTAVTGNRYAEQVMPVMIYTQRKLIERVREHDGQLPPQHHFRAAMASLGGGPITPQQYTTLQLKSVVLKEDVSVVDVLARQIDPEGHDHYQGGTHALKRCSAPLDVDYSLQLLREALGDAQYTARALNHSRQLLSLYLAGQTSVIFATVLPVDNSSDIRVQSRVDFIPNTARPQAIMPVDLTQEEFHFTDDIENTSFPSSQINVVMASYRNTIDMLLAGDKMELAAEAMHELGNLHFHINDIRAAYKWWADVLDALLGTRDAIHSWRRVLSGDTDRGQWLLAKCGLWGCLLGGVVASNIAQYILTCDLGRRRECCFLAGYFFKALFRSSFPHPTADKDYALYEVGEGFEVENLMSGVDFMSERFRLNGRILVAALRFVTEELVRGRHNLFVLPLLTLYQYFTTSVCRDLQRTVDGRILRVRALTELGFFSEAVVILQRLLTGDKLPLTTTSLFRNTEGRPFNVRFTTAKPLLDQNNLKVLENLVARQLPAKLASLYGPHLTCHLSLVQAHLLIAIADTIPLLPVFSDVTVPGSTLIIEPSQPRAASGNRSARLSAGSAHAPPTKSPVAKPKGKADVDEEADVGPGVKRGVKCFTNPKKPLTLEIVKGTLLAAADVTLSSMSEVIIENANAGGGVAAMPAAELELVILCRIDLAAIANQRHHCPLAARIILTAIKMLQDTSVFQQKAKTSQGTRTSSLKKVHIATEAASTSEGSKKEAVEDHHHSRARLDAQLWLQCKHVLVQSLVGEMRGMGLVRGEESSVKRELGDVRGYCEEGVTESGACGDDEMQAEFLLQSVLLDMVDGVAVDDMKTALDEILKILAGVRQLSTRGQLLQVMTHVHLTDLRAAVPSTRTSEGLDIVDFTKGEYIDAQQQLLQQLEEHGEKILRRYGNEHQHDTPVAPLGNIYLPHLTYLVQVKLRIGHAMARLTALTINNSRHEPVSAWSQPLGVLATAAELCKVIPARSSGVEAEILLNMGKVQRKLFHHGKGHQKVVAETLISAIKVSLANEHDLGLIRQAYLELAILYMSSSGLVALNDHGILDPVAPADRPGTASTTMPKTKRHRSRASSSNKTRDSTPTIHSLEGDSFTAMDAEREMERESERKAAWAAVRCAAAVGQAHHTLSLLIGHSAVTSGKVGPNADPPEFASLDLVGSYVIGERKQIFKNDIEEEMAPLVEMLEPPPVETYSDQLRKTKTTVQDLSWIHILGYQSILQRLVATATLTVSSSDDSPTGHAPAGKLGSEFDLGFISHAQSNVGINENVVRNVLFSAPWMLRLSNLHHFLAQHLTVYVSDCTAIYPPLTLQLPASPDDIEAGVIPLIKTTYSGNLVTELPTEASTRDVGPSRPQSVAGGHHSKSLLAISDNDLCMQWYRPSLDEYSIQPPQPSVGSSVRRDMGEQVVAPDKQVMLLFAMSKKPDKMTSSMLWVSQSQLVDLHDRLTVLKQRAEITLGEVMVKKEPSVLSVASSKGSKKQARVKPMSPKLKRDEHLEVLLGQCMMDVLKLLRVLSVSDESLLSLLMEEKERPTSPATVQSGHVPAMGTAMTMTATPTNLTVGTMGTTDTMGTADDRVQISFEVTKANVQMFQQLFDPGSGGFLKHGKMLSWFLSLFPSHSQ